MAKTGKAVVVREHGGGVSVEEVTVESPGPGEVMVKIEACGVCASDAAALSGKMPLPPPLILGHEGCGIIEELGEGIADLEVGDKVLMSFIPQCGCCRFCADGEGQLCDDHAKVYFTLPDGTTRAKDGAGNPLFIFSGCGCMAQYTTVVRNSVVKIDSDLPSDKACLVACGVLTGVGAALNTAKVKAGSTAAVFGVGGIGLNVVQGCAIAGAEKIIAVDLEDKKLEMAQQFGATHTVNPNNGDPVAQIHEITGGGSDYAFECIGLGPVVLQAFAATRKGGHAVVVGVSAPTEMVPIPAIALTTQEKHLSGSWFGSGVPRRDYPRLLNLYRSNRLKLDELVTNTYSVDDAQQAFDDLKAGLNARGVILFD
ncbi:MAG: Zn-dependent alcohol dehydrogenase [Deltaproteobacteria bacterium]|nr:Zn-dependent alcohol dehydrogenase [Deltaproteobacteria bacterium]MBW2446184.1 Zn-dependent alcohol dehydrogenase [Deltaproteobacteria bacterium]